MLPRLVATDLDGTLLRDDGTVDARTRGVIAELRARGTETVVCTARPARWMVEIAADAGIGGPAICANGAVVWDLDGGAPLESLPVAANVARQVVERLRELIAGAAFAVEWIDRFGREPAYDTRWPVADDTVIADIETLLVTPPVKLLLRHPGTGLEGLVPQVRDAVGELVEVTFSDAAASLLEMSAPGVSKGAGLAALCAARGIPASDVVAFGDMPNDLSMLTWAGRGVAMGNAHPGVAAAADEVTLSNQEGGVAAVLERLLADADADADADTDADADADTDTDADADDGAHARAPGR
jgi:Cof subfamily protein (haloacid dehalogenase superfamily)